MDEDFDFAGIMAAPAAPQAQARPLQVVENGDDFAMILTDISDSHGLDVQPVALSLVPYEKLVKILVLRAKEIVVEDEEGRKAATDLGNRAKKARLKIENSIKKSPNYLAAENYLKTMRNLCNALAEPLKGKVEQVLKDKIAVYVTELRLEQERKDAIAREEARKRQAELDAEADRLRKEAQEKAEAAKKELERKDLTTVEKSLLEETVEAETTAASTIVAPQVMPKVEAPPNVVRSEAGASFAKSRWIARLVDVQAIPKAYLEDEKVQEALTKVAQRDADAGMRKIPGFIIEDKLSISFRG